MELSLAELEKWKQDNLRPSRTCHICMNPRLYARNDVGLRTDHCWKCEAEIEGKKTARQDPRLVSLNLALNKKRDERDAAITQDDASKYQRLQGPQFGGQLVADYATTSYDIVRVPFGDRLPRLGIVPDDHLDATRKDISETAAKLLQLSPAEREERMEKAGDDDNNPIPAVEHLNFIDYEHEKISEGGVIAAGFAPNHPKNMEGWVGNPSRLNGARQCSAPYHELREHLIMLTVPRADRDRARRGGLYRHTLTFFPRGSDVDSVLQDLADKSFWRRPGDESGDVDPSYDFHKDKRTLFNPERHNDRIAVVTLSGRAIVSVQVAGSYRTRKDRDSSKASTVKVAVDTTIESESWYAIDFDTPHAVKSSADRVAIVFRGLELRDGLPCPTPKA